MEKKEKTWQRRGLFALVSNRRKDPFPAGEDPMFPSGDEDALRSEEEE